METSAFEAVRDGWEEEGPAASDSEEGGAEREASLMLPERVAEELRMILGKSASCVRFRERVHTTRAPKTSVSTSSCST